MEKQTLPKLFEGKLFKIPDYQRGYAWGTKQWNDFIVDIDSLIDEDIKSHYTGTIVVYQDPKNPIKEPYTGTRKYEVVEVVDGQQRLTTCILYLSIILRELIARGQEEYEREQVNYLYSGSICKLHLNNDTAACFYELISKGRTDSQYTTIHQKRIVEAYDYLSSHISKRCKKEGDNALNYLAELFEAIVDKLNFTFYVIESPSEIGMTFELMNSRGKELSVLELLKNYLMHWIYRHCPNDHENRTLSDLVNKSWKNIYTNIAKCEGSEDQCLRIAWTLYCDHLPKNWQGYEGFKQPQYIPIRGFSNLEDVERVKNFIKDFVNGLSEISYAYAHVIKPTGQQSFNTEYKWLTKIHNTGNIANFLPLLVASKLKYNERAITKEEYVDVLETV